MEKLSLNKRRCIIHIIQLYLEGMSYDEIARGANVTKTTVGYVILRLKTG